MAVSLLTKFPVNVVLLAPTLRWSVTSSRVFDWAYDVFSARRLSV